MYHFSLESGEVCTLLMQRHDSQERMAWKRGRPVPHRLLRHWTRARRNILCGLQNVVAFRSLSPLPTDHGSVVTAILGATDSFNGRSNTAYKNWLQAMQPTAATREYASFIKKKVASQEDGVWTTGTVQCLHQGILRSMTRMLPANSILPN